MAVRTLKVVVCDACGSGEETHRYTVTFPAGNRRGFDLCTKCVGTTPLRDLADLAGAHGRGPKGHQQPVLTEDQIEARVKRGRKRA